MSFYQFGRGLAAILLKPVYRIEVSFEEPVPEGRGFILACNHVSDMDPVVLGIAFPGQVRYMAKSELFKVPVLGFLIKHLGAFPVARGKGDHGAIDRAVSLVAEGGVLGIFPEGGRSKDGKFHKVKSGTVVVASQTAADILPACIIYGPRRWFHRRVVTVKFGRVIRNEELHITDHNKTELRAANALLGGRIAALLGVEAP